MSELIGLRCAAKIEATDGTGKSKPRLAAVAYGGGLMVAPNFGPVVIDLAGLDVSTSIRLLIDHRNEMDGIAGQGRAEVRSNALHVEGTLTEATEAGRKVIALARDGIEFEASVCVSPLKTERITGKRVTVNGRTFEGENFTLVRAGKLKEVSIVAAGADHETSVRIAAQHKEHKPMGEQKTQEVTDPVEELRAREAAESKRIADIRTISAAAPTKYHVTAAKAAEIEAKSIADGTSANDTELALLRASYSQGPGIMPRPAMPTGDILAAALLLRAGMSKVAEKGFGDDGTIAQKAHDIHAQSFPDICAAALRAEGMAIPHGREAMIRAAFSTVSLPNAVGSSVEKVLVESYRETPATWRSFAKVVPAKNFRDHKAIRPSYVGNMEEVAADGELKHASLSEDLATTFSVDTFGKILRVTRQTVINDDMGFLNDTASAFGRMSKRGVNDLIWKVILANAGSFFGSGNSNVLGAAALSIDNLALAATTMRTQRDANNNDLDLIPRVLAVPPELETTGRQLLESIEIDYSAGADVMPSGNPLKALATLEVESRLSNTEKFTNASTTGWYLFGGPQDAPVLVAFLDGIENPRIEFFGLDHDANTLGMAWRVYLDYGAALNDPRAAVQSDGA